MKSPRYIRVALAVIGIGLALGVGAVWADPTSQVGRLYALSGSVSFRPGSLDEWAPATLNYPLTAGDYLWMDRGARAELQLRSAALRLSSETEFSFLTLDDETVQLRLSQGSLYVDLRAIDQGGVFEIDTPNAVVSLLAAGKYRVDVRPNGDTSVAVRAGDAEVTAGGYARDLPAGQSTNITGSASISYSGMGNLPPDAWDSYCADRDRQEDQFASGAYVSREMIGVEDLDANGTWSVTADYGPTWTPSRVPSGWAPYRFGQWAWVEPWGWTWIDEAPWGFAPFHYGRWLYVNARWLWLPGAMTARPLYAPALVVFVGGSGWTPGGGEGIGWFPLGPREVYVPPYQASVEYVRMINVMQVTNINITIIRNYDVNKVVFMNRNAPRAMTVVPREAFARSRSAGGSVLAVSPEDISRAPLMGMTAKIAPQRESVVARPNAPTSPVSRPPAALQTRQVYSRIVPAPAPVPFAQQQKSLQANPGRPLAPADVSTLQRNPKNPVAPVQIVQPKPAPAQAPVPARASANQARPGQARPAPAAAQAPASQSASRASALISTLKNQTLPNADRQLSEARKVAGIRLDFNAVAGRIAAARQALSGAERDLAAQKYDNALQEANAIQSQVGELTNQISAAMRSASVKNVPAQSSRQSPDQNPAQGPQKR